MCANKIQFISGWQQEQSNNNCVSFPDAVVANEEKQDKTVVKIPDPVPQESAFGKGKRSRIPNKKYESLGMKSFAKIHSYGAEHGEFGENDEKTENGISKLNSTEVTSSMDTTTEEGTPIKEESEVTSSYSPYVTKKKSLGSPGTPLGKKPKLAVDLSNPCYLKPLDHGWKRELVYRATPDSNMKRNGDVYYYTPTGKKVRSMREVAENLKNKELTIDDFTFFKEPLGINDPEKEIIRDAKMKGGGGTPGVPKKATPKAKTPKEKTSPKVSTPIGGATPPSEGVTTPPKPGKSPRLGGFKVFFVI